MPVIRMKRRDFLLGPAAAGLAGTRPPAIADAALPPYRKAFLISGYVEDWAEYTRGLTVEASVYADDPLGHYAHRLMNPCMVVSTVVIPT